MGTEVKQNGRGTNGEEVVLEISNEAQPDEKKRNPSFTSKDFVHKQRKDPNLELTQMNAPPPTPQVPTFPAVAAAVEISSSTPSPNRPPKVPTDTLTRRPTLSRSDFSKPKSRFVEPSGPVVSSLVEELNSEPARNIPVTTNTPSRASSDEEEEDEDIYKIENVASKMKKSRKRFKVFVMVEWVVLVAIWGFLLASLTVPALQHFMVWGLEIWKWCVLVLVIVSGGLMTKWFVHVLVFLIEKNFLLKNKVLYFIYGVRKSVQVFIWVGLVLLTWVLLINRGVKRSKHASKILGYVSRALVSFLVGSIIWMVKTLLVKLLATNFQCSRFFDRIQESLFHQYVLQTLSGPPMMEIAENIGSTPSKRELSFRSTKKGKGDEHEIIDLSKLNKMNQQKVSAWTMKGLVNAITTTGLSTISNTLDKIENERDEQKDNEITNEWEAKAAAVRIFKNVAKPGIKYIDIEDLLRFLNKADVGNVLPLFEGAAEIGKIKKSALRNWVVKVYHDRKSLAHSLNDTKTAVRQLNNIISAIVIVVIIIVWLLIMGVATVKVLVFISSQMVVAAFMFGNTAKTIFESIIFVFVMHPFDVGDRCVIGGVQMIVEEMNILTTVFLRYDNEKIYYPNSVLATKPISNFYRSPDMGDNVDFAVDVSTSVESIGALRAKIKMYLENKPQHWRPNHSVVVKEIENMNKMKMALYITHTMNHQNFAEKNNRRTELVIEMKKIFEDLSIKYNLLPQEVHLSYVGSSATAPTTFRH